MIYSETQVRVPGKRYELNVHCISTTRLTSMAWLILTCISRFKTSKNMSHTTIKDAFESVLQLQDSALLIKPCVEELKRLRLIEFANGEYEYDETTFGEISLTPLGAEMLSQGLLPGDPVDFPMTVYFNPLTGKLDNHEVIVSKKDSAVLLGNADDYPETFPKDTILNDLQSGRVGDGRFSASKYRIEDLEALETKEFDSFIKIVADVDSYGVITTTPAIAIDQIKEKVVELFTSKEISGNTVSSFYDLDDFCVSSIIGSGNRLKTAVIEVCKNGNFLFLDESIYELYKRNTSAFKGKTIVLFNATEFAIENDSQGITIRIPNIFPIEGCVVINEKNDHVCYARAKYSYESKLVEVPVALKDKRLLEKNQIALRWLESTISNLSKDNINVLSLYTLPLFADKADILGRTLDARWEEIDFNDFLVESTNLSKACEMLGYFEIDLQSVAGIATKKLLGLPAEEEFSALLTLVDLGFISRGSEEHVAVAKEVLQKFEAPSSFAELKWIIEALGITDTEIAVAFDELINPLYSIAIIEELIESIVNDSYELSLPLFEKDDFFNSYSTNLKEIELLVSGLKIFESTEESILLESIKNCPDIARLQTCIAAIADKNADLVDCGINIYDVIKNTDEEKARCFYDNVHSIEFLTSKTVDEVIESISIKKSELVSVINGAEISTEAKEEFPEVTAPIVKEKFYIFDTCALMHYPDIMLYCEPEAYIRIPYTVIEELNKIKDHRSKEYSDRSTAQGLLVDIDKLYLKYCNINNRPVFAMENSQSSLLPNDLDKTNPDNKILSVVLKHAEHDVHLITDDIGFRVKAAGVGVDAISAKDFMDAKKEHKVSLVELKNKYSAVQDSTVQKELEAENLIESKEKESDDKLNDILSTMKIQSIKTYIPEINDKVCNYLKSHGVKTIADFCALDVDKVSKFTAEGKDAILKNTIAGTLANIPVVKSKIKSKYNIK